MDDNYRISLEKTLRNALVPDSNIIQKASQQLTKEFYTNPLALTTLFQIIEKTTEEDLKQLVLVEINKLIITKWERIEENVKTRIRETVLSGLFEEKKKQNKRFYAHILTSIASIDLSENKWPELFTTLVDIISNGSEENKDISAYTLYTLLDSQMLYLVSHIDDFLVLFSRLITEDNLLELRVTSLLALEAISKYIEEYASDDTELIERFQKTIPMIVNLLQTTIQMNDYKKTDDVFNVFNEMIFLDSKFFGPQLIDLIKFMAEISVNKHLDEDTRILALKFLISSVQFKKSKINSAKLGPQLTFVAVQIASEEIDIKQELENEDVENENEENSCSSLSLRLIAVLSSELSPSQVLSPLLNNLSKMMSSHNIFERRAALLCIGVSSTGAPDFISMHVQRIIPYVIGSLKDPEMVIKVAALKTLFQLSSELQDIVADYHDQLLPLIIDIIESSTTVLVYKNAFYALDGLIEFMSHYSIGKYLDPLINKLFPFLQNANSVSLKSAIISVIGSTAFASGKAFTPYLDNSIRLLQPFIFNLSSIKGLTEDEIELRALTFENIASMSRAVGSEAFINYANVFVDAAYDSLNSEHSRIRESGFAFISNMAKVYGPKFSGFLDQIVPKIFKCLNQSEINLDNDDLLDHEELGDSLNVYTGITIEKEIASVALIELAIGTGKDFIKYVEPSIKTLSNQIDNSYGMREAATNALFKIVKAVFYATNGKDFVPEKGIPVRSYIDPSFLTLIHKVRDIVIPLLDDEFDFTMITCFLDNISDFINTFGSIFLVNDNNDTQPLVDLCMKLIKFLKKDHISHFEESHSKDDDDDDDSSETEVLLHESVLEVLVRLSIALESDFLKIFDSFKPLIFSFCNSKSKAVRISSVGSLAEICRGLKGADNSSNEILELFIQKLSKDDSLEVRGNAAYGIGLIFEHSQNDFSSLSSSILQLLFSLLKEAEKELSVVDGENKDTIQRCIANQFGCISRILMKEKNFDKSDELIAIILNHLPLEVAFEENEPIFNLIIHLFEARNEFMLSSTNRVIEIFSRAFVLDAARTKIVNESTLGREENIQSMKQFSTDELKQRVIDFLRYMESVNPGIVSQNEVLKFILN